MRDGRLVGATETSKELAEWRKPAKKETVASEPQREQLASTSELPLLKGNRTEPSVQSTRL